MASLNTSFTPHLVFNIFSHANNEFPDVLTSSSSKTVLLALLLNRFGYDVIIINDLPNSHSMLAINMPHSGRYITFKGKRYYAWETTTKGWKPGMLPPDYARWNMDNYWIPFVWFQ